MNPERYTRDTPTNATTAVAVHQTTILDTRGACEHRGEESDNPRKVAAAWVA